MTFVYQAPDSARGALGYLTNGWQVSGSYRWLHGTPYTASLNIGGGTVGSVNMTGSPSAGPRIALTGDAVSRRWSSDPYRQFNLAAFAMPAPGSVGLASPR